MKKQYSFLQEVVGTVLFAGLTALSAYSLFKNLRSNSFNNSYINNLNKEINNCDPNDRNGALNIINKYASILNKIKFNNEIKVNRSMLKKLQMAQNFFFTNYYTPLKQIISNNNDLNWKQSALNYISKNHKKIKRKNNLNTAIHATSLGLSGAGAAGIQAAKYATMSIFAIRNLLKQLKFFNGNKYIKKMEKELQKCPETDRITARNIVNKYCFDITSYIQNTANKTNKKIPFNIQQKMRHEFAGPLLDLINDTNNKYWKIMVMDMVQQSKLQNTVQHICDTVTTAITTAYGFKKS